MQGLSNVVKHMAFKDDYFAVLAEASSGKNVDYWRFFNAFYPYKCVLFCLVVVNFQDTKMKQGISCIWSKFI